ncbi:MAG: cytochrome c biogenesis protein CcsA [Thermaerobacter sp.]|nr:cytochrome c biogenesis protein CcsA [Thermaerobacter sp.]
MSAYLLAAASVAYGGAALLHFLAQRRRWLLRPATLMTFAALSVQALLIVAQALRGMPMDLFDWLQTALFSFVLAFAIWARGDRGAGAGAIVLPIAFAVTAATALLGRGSGPAPLHGSALLWLHVGFLAFGFACLALAGAAALLRRLAESRLRRGAFGTTAPLPQLQVAVRRFLGTGLILDAVGIALGAVYARAAWGAYWSWDLKETVTLIVWMIDLCAYLAVRAGRRLALGDWLAATGLVGMLANIWAVGLLTGPHHFNW